MDNNNNVLTDLADNICPPAVIGLAESYISNQFARIRTWEANAAARANNIVEAMELLMLPPLPSQQNILNALSTGNLTHSPANAAREPNSLIEPGNRPIDHFQSLEPGNRPIDHFQLLEPENLPLPFLLRQPRNFAELRSIISMYAYLTSPQGFQENYGIGSNDPERMQTRSSSRGAAVTDTPSRARGIRRSTRGRRGGGAGGVSASARRRSRYWTFGEEMALVTLWRLHLPRIHNYYLSLPTFRSMAKTMTRWGSPLTTTQCRRKIIEMKKRYEAERERRLEEVDNSDESPDANWRMYEMIDAMLNPRSSMPSVIPVINESEVTQSAMNNIRQLRPDLAASLEPLMEVPLMPMWPTMPLSRPFYEFDAYNFLQEPEVNNFPAERPNN